MFAYFIVIFMDTRKIFGHLNLTYNLVEQKKKREEINSCCNIAPYLFRQFTYLSNTYC